MEPKFLIHEVVKCGKDLEHANDYILSITTPVSEEDYGEVFWYCSYRVEGPVTMEYTDNSTSKLSALSGALMGMRAFLREQMEVDGLRIFANLDKESGYEEVDFDTFFGVLDCSA